MKKTILTFLILLPAFAAWSQTIANGNFEDWTNGEPDYWNTFNYLKPTISRTDSAHGGNYALMGRVDTVGGFNATPYLFTDSMGGGFGFPLMQRYTSVKFWYRFFSDSGDILVPSVLILDQQGQGMGTGVATFTPVGQYVQGTIPIYYTSVNQPARMQITFTTNPTMGSSAHIGTTFFIDDVTLTEPTAIEEATNTISMKPMFPNPASKVTTLTYELQQPGEANIQLTDMSGRIVLNEAYPAHNSGVHQKQIDVSTLTPGLYIASVRTPGNIATGMVQVVR